jgi:transposase-like protein
MKRCPQCQDEERAVKAGRTAAGSQRYRCKGCGHKYTPEPKARGYPPETRAQAIRQYVDGGNLRRIARQLGVVHQTVATWVSAHADALPEHPPQPDGPVAVAELDELYTFVGDKKTRATS